MKTQIMAVAMLVTGVALSPISSHADEAPTLESAEAEAGKVLKEKKEAKGGQGAASEGVKGSTVSHSSLWTSKAAVSMFNSAKNNEIGAKALVGDWKRVAQVLSYDGKVGLYKPGGIGSGGSFMSFKVESNPFDPNLETLHVSVEPFFQSKEARYLGLSGPTTPLLEAGEVEVLYRRAVPSSGKDDSSHLSYECRRIDDERLICLVGYSLERPWARNPAFLESGNWYIGLERIKPQGAGK